MGKIIKSSMIALMMMGSVYAIETNDIKVRNTKSVKVNLDGYKTYQITKESGIISTTDKKPNSTIDVNIEIKHIINRELSKKGKVLALDNPDFLVAYSAGTEGNTAKDKRPESAMAMVLIDAQTGVVIDKATVEAEFKNSTDDDLKKRLQYAIEKMLSNL